jgi:hypothetical protein
LKGGERIYVSTGDPTAGEKGPSRVIVTDVDMPMGAMVAFMIKWAIASIPAFIILFLLALIATVVFGGISAGLLRGAIR